MMFISCLKESILLDCGESEYKNEDLNIDNVIVMKKSLHRETALPSIIFHCLGGTDVEWVYLKEDDRNKQYEKIFETASKEWR